jgi:hypothetical protein
MVAEATKMLFLAALVWMVTTKPTMVAVVAVAVAAVGAAAAAAARMLKDAKNIHAVPLSLQSGMQQKILQATMFTTSTL